MGTVYKDPRNNHIYNVDEKKINSTLSKVGVPYFGSEDAVEIDVPEKHLKLENHQELEERMTFGRNCASLFGGTVTQRRRAMRPQKFVSRLKMATRGVFLNREADASTVLLLVLWRR
ncbi:hypothetical protein BC830DRAFT_1119317 [Chytriomyces sp. MP71]|nr:hypothetical protein BC830DRAFT_1119317 [Chytriomyces sp. MP71]